MEQRDITEQNVESGVKYHAKTKHKQTLNIQDHNGFSSGIYFILRASSKHVLLEAMAKMCRF